MWPTFAKHRVHTSWTKERIPCPAVEDSDGFYSLEIIKDGAHVSMIINDLLLWSWYDDESPGPRIMFGRIGFRQMSPMKACYRNLEVRAL